MGRVVTLVKSDNTETNRVYGIAYKLKTENIEKTFEHLNFREKCGYSLNIVSFNQFSYDGHNLPPIKCLCYFANENNIYYSPQSDLSQLANQISNSQGPSGTNKDYLFNLCKKLRELSVKAARNDERILDQIRKFDAHIFSLEDSTKKFEKEKNDSF